MTVDELHDAVPGDVQKKVDASIDVRQHAAIFGDRLKQYVPENRVAVRGSVFDTVYASIVALDARDVGATDRLKGYIQQLLMAARQLGVDDADIEKTYFAFWR